MLDSTMLKSNCLVVYNVQAYYHENILVVPRHEVVKLSTRDRLYWGGGGGPRG